jgi:enamine deaminase RidA (YjgF/YER057c/UK114 family)
MPVMSRAVVRGDTVYLCGVVPIRWATSSTQTRQVLEKIDQMLASAAPINRNCSPPRSGSPT